MAKVTFHIEGLSELKDALEELPKATSTNVQKRALMAAGDLIQGPMEAMAPEAPNSRYKMHMKRTITVSGKLSNRARKLDKKASKVEIYVGPAELPRARYQEFGTPTNAPHPFIRPAWDQNKMKALVSIKELLAEEIKKAAERLARKAARLAAKL